MAVDVFYACDFLAVDVYVGESVEHIEIKFNVIVS